MTYESMGWVIGAAVGIVLIIVVMKFLNKDKAIRTEYDERQKIVRGVAYKAGFYTCLITNAFMMLLATGKNGLNMLGYSAFFIPILAGVVAQVSYSIFKDGYIGLNTNMTRFIVIMAVIGGFNFFIAVMAMINGELVVDGRLQGSFINLLCGILFLIIAAELVIKKCLDIREE